MPDWPLHPQCTLSSPRVIVGPVLASPDGLGSETVLVLNTMARNALWNWWSNL